MDVTFLTFGFLIKNGYFHPKTVTSKMNFWKNGQFILDKRQVYDE